MTYSAVVVGSGRSGTSLVAGLLADAGLNLGDDLIPASSANPTGYHEDLRVNALNDELLKPLLGPEHDLTACRLAWIAALPAALFAGGQVTMPSNVQQLAMAACVPADPFCIKDPRFSYTLDAWRPLLVETRFVAVFRHPASVVRSVQRDIERNPAYYDGFHFDPAHGYEMWAAMNRRILDHHSRIGKWLFVDADQLAASGDVSSLATHIETPVPSARIDPKLLGDPVAGAPSSALELHRELLERSVQVAQSSRASRSGRKP